MMRRQERLLQRLLQATETMVQGGLSETSRRCGNPNCICRRDPKRLHGPHLYITYRLDGKSRSLYVPPEHAKTARRAQMSNVSMMVRPDGGFEIVARSGAIMIGTNGILGPYKLQGRSIYSNMPGLPTRNLEDPVVWYSGGMYQDRKSTRL